MLLILWAIFSAANITKKHASFEIVDKRTRIMEEGAFLVD